MDVEKADVIIHEVHRILTAARPQRGDTDDPKNWPQYQLIWPHLTPSNAANCDEEPVRQLLIRPAIIESQKSNARPVLGATTDV